MLILFLFILVVILFAVLFLCVIPCFLAEPCWEWFVAVVFFAVLFSGVIAGINLIPDPTNYGDTTVERMLIHAEPKMRYNVASSTLFYDDALEGSSFIKLDMNQIVVNDLADIPHIEITTQEKLYNNWIYMISDEINVTIYLYVKDISLVEFEYPIFYRESK